MNHNKLVITALAVAAFATGCDKVQPAMSPVGELLSR